MFMQGAAGYALGEERSSMVKGPDAMFNALRGGRPD